MAKNAIGTGPASNVVNTTPSEIIPVTWVDLVGVDVNGNSITKTASTAWGNGGAASLESFTGDGGIEFLASQTNKHRMCGLSSININASHKTIEYAIYLRSNGQISVFESGVNKGDFGPFQIGDHFTVERVGSTIVYKKNGVVFYTSLTPTSSTLFVDTAIYHTGGEISDVKLIGTANIDSGPTQTATLINIGDTWKYFKGYSNPGSGWNDTFFGDSYWLEGPTGLGYGDGDDATVLSDMEDNYLTVYTRKTFNVSDPSTITDMLLNIDYDDGFVAYINGQEVARANMPGGIPDFYTVAGTSHEAGTSETFDLTLFLDYLVSGSNVLAIEVHNQDIGSLNLSMIPELKIVGQRDTN